MANEWILDVLADLSDFAEKNQMTGLARQLDRTVRVAQQDMGMNQSLTPGTAGQGVRHVGIIHREFAAGGDAR